MPNCNFGQHSDMLSREVTKPRPQIFVLSDTWQWQNQGSERNGKKGMAMCLLHEFPKPAGVNQDICKTEAT